jgi:hypothetical protein
MQKDEIHRMMVEFGKKGGQSTFLKHGRDHFKKMRQKGLEKARKKKEQDEKDRRQQPV